MIQKIIDFFGLKAERTHNTRHVPMVKPILHKDPWCGEGRKNSWKYCTRVGKLAYQQGIRLEIPVSVHQCTIISIIKHILSHERELVDIWW